MNKLLPGILVALWSPALFGAVILTGTNITVPVPAAPGGGGEFSHGDEVIITGSGFGTGPTTAFLQPTIEATNVSATISLSAPFVRPTDNNATFVGYDDAERGRAVRAASGSPANHAISWDRGTNVSTNDLLYFTWWLRAETLGGSFPAQLNDNGGTTFPGSGDWQWKIARFRFDNDFNDSGGSGDSYVAHWDNSDGSFYGGESAGFHYINGLSPSPFINNVSGTRAAGDHLPTAYGQDWYRVEWIWDMGDTGTGRSFLYVTREGGTRNLVASATGISWFDSGRQWRYLVAQHYFGNPPGGSSFSGSFVAMDDFFVARGNLKRVELTDNCTLASATFREIQNPSAWSGTSITVDLNTGAGRTGDLCLVVVDTSATTRNDTVLGSLEITVN